MKSAIIQVGVGLSMLIALLFWFGFMFGNTAASFPSVMGIPAEYWGLIWLGIIVSAGAWLYSAVSGKKEVTWTVSPLGIVGVVVILVLCALPILIICGLSALVDDHALPISMKVGAFATALEVVFGVKTSLDWGGVIVSAVSTTWLHLWFIIQLIVGSLGLGLCVRYLLPKQSSRGSIVLFSIGGGLTIIQVLLFVLGVFGYIGRLPGGVSPLFLLFLIGFGVLIWKGRDLWVEKVVLKVSPLKVMLWVILFAVGVTTLAHLMRPIPIGWDDTSVYMNIPRLLAGGGELVTGYGMHNWGLIMSLGFLEGKASFALVASSIGGFLSLLALYIGIRETSDEDNPTISLLLVTVLAVTPMFLFQLGEDLKVDLAMLFFSILAIVLTMLWSKKGEYRTWHVAVLIGMFLGIAVGIKVTAVLVLLYVGVLIALRAGGIRLFASVLLLFGAGVLVGDLVSFSGVVLDSTLRYGVGAVLGILGVGLLTGKTIHWKLAIHGILVLALTGALVLPWVGLHYHSLCEVECSHISSEGLLFGKADAPILPMTPVGEQGESSDATLLSLDVRKEGGAKVEEVARYRGFDQGMLHYLSLPFDVTFSKNISGDYVTVGWVYLVLIILGGVVIAYRGEDSRWRNILLAQMGIVILLVTAESILPKVPDWGALLLPLALYTLVVTSVWKLRGDKTMDHHAHVYIAIVTFGLAWVFLGSGVPWYGIAGFALLLLLGGRILESKSPSSTVMVAMLVCMWVVPLSIYRFTMTATHQVVLGIIEGKVTLDQKEIRSFDHRQFVLYKAGLLDDDQAFQAMNPAYFEAGEYFNQHKEGYIYRVGTLLPYFIEGNNKRMLTDNQLDLFLERYVRHGSVEGFVSELQEGGFAYIIYDQNTSSIDQTGKNTLKRKAMLFEEVLSEQKYFDKVYSGGGFEIYNVL